MALVITTYAVLSFRFHLFVALNLVTFSIELVLFIVFISAFVEAGSILTQ